MHTTRKRRGILIARFVERPKLKRPRATYDYDRFPDDKYRRGRCPGWSNEFSRLSRLRLSVGATRLSLSLPLLPFSPLFHPLRSLLLAGVKQAKPSRCRAAMRLICEEQLRGQTENSSGSLNDSLGLYSVPRFYIARVSVSHLFTRNSFKLF